MDAIAPIKPTLEPPAPPAQRETETLPEANAAASSANDDNAAEPRAPAAPGHLLVRLDSEAGRFVQTMTDSSSQETIWRYPSEAQLAYSRAVKAYLRALSE